MLCERTSSSSQGRMMGRSSSSFAMFSSCGNEVDVLSADACCCCCCCEATEAVAVAADADADADEDDADAEDIISTSSIISHTDFLTVI